MGTTETVPCMICGETKSEPIYLIPPLGIVRCSACGHVYTSPRYIAHERARIYDSGYISTDLGRDVLLPGYLDRKEIFLDDARNRLRIISIYVSPPGRCLDIGAGGGFFLAAAKQQGWAAVGTDLSKAMVEYAQRAFGIEIVHGPFDAMQFPPSHFDLVTMWHVLDHMEDVVRTLALANSILRRDGLLAVTVPDITSTNARRLRHKWIHLQPEVHLHHFSQETLTSLLTKTGFAPVKVSREGGTGACASGAVPDRCKRLIGEHIRWLSGIRRAVSFANTRLLRRYDSIAVYAQKAHPRAGR